MISEKHKQILRETRKRELANGQILFGGKVGQKKRAQTIRKQRLGRSYTEIYGKERALIESQKRALGNKRFDATNIRHTVEGKKNCEIARNLIAAERKNKTYYEIYGNRANEEVKKRSETHRKKWLGKRKVELRPKHNMNWEYQEWRTAIFKRDEFICQRCKKRGGTLHANHIKPWAKFPNERYLVTNGKTLCASPCHKEEHKELKLHEEKIWATCDRE